MRVCLEKHRYGYRVLPADDSGKVLAEFFGKDAKHKALEFIKEKGWKLACAC